MVAPRNRVSVRDGPATGTMHPADPWLSAGPIVGVTAPALAAGVWAGRVAGGGRGNVLPGLLRRAQKRRRVCRGSVERSDTRLEVPVLPELRDAGLVKDSGARRERAIVWTAA